MDLQEKLQSAEQDISGKEQMLQAIAQLFPDPIFVINRDGKWLDVVGGSEWSIYRSGKFIINKYLHNLLPPDLSDQFMQAITAAIEENCLKTFDYQLGAEDIAGSPPDSLKARQWFEARIFPLAKKDDETATVVLLPVNITQRKNLEEQIKDLAARDPLTKAFNRKYFMNIFEKEFAISKRYKNRLSVLYIAIDRLQRINDEYGEGAGDAVLKKFTVFCETTLRDADLFARYEGAGFIAMLPNTPSLGAAIIAERIRAQIEKLSLDYDGETINFTISMGISEAQDTDSTSNAVLTRADAALYKAKAGGRNRIEMN